MKEKIVLLGKSSFDLAIACDFAKEGASVIFWEANLESESRVSITAIEPDLQRTYEFVKSPSLAVIGQATMIVANFSGSYDSHVLDAIAPYMHSGQVFVIFPGYFLAEEISDRLQDKGVKGILVCELTSSPCVCELIEPTVIQIFKRKKILKMATIPQAVGAEVLFRLQLFLPMLRLAGSVIETSLENINSILHPLPILLNLVEVVHNPQGFRHYIDGIDEHVDILLQLMDKERISVGHAWGVVLDPVVEHLKNFYGNNSSTTIHEYIQTPECPYEDIRGYGLQSRYITVDIPGLVLPTIRLAQAKHVETPLFDACLSLARPFLP